MAGIPWGEDEDEDLRKHHAEGVSMSEAARRLGRSPSSVQSRAEYLGLRWDSTQTRAAVEMKKARAKAKRANLRLQMLEDAQKLQDQMFSEATVFNFGGKDNVYAEATLPEPPSADKLKLAQTISNTLASIEKLDRMDSEQEIEKDLGMLEALFVLIKQTDEENKDLEELI